MATFKVKVQDIDCDGIYCYYAQQTVNFMAIAQGPACEVWEGGYAGGYSWLDIYPRTRLSDGKIQTGDILFEVDNYVSVVKAAIAINDPSVRAAWFTTASAEIWPRYGAALAES